MQQRLFPIICCVLILIGWAGTLMYFASDSKQECNQFCEMEDLSLQLREINYKLDWVEKALVSLTEEKTALLEDREHIITEAQNIYKNLFTVIDPMEHNGVREPGQITEDGSHQVMPEVSDTNDSHQRFKDLISAYGLDPSMIREVENHYWITEWVIGCIAVAETSGWKKGAGKNNIGNVGNTDSNPRWQSYSNVWASLDAIGRTLNNGYLGKKQTLWCLSNAGSCSEQNDNGKRYASSDGNRERNMVACLAQIYNTTIDPSTFSIRR